MQVSTKSDIYDAPRNADRFQMKHRSYLL